MQSILGLDLSSQPCELTVCRMDGGHVEVLERRVVELPLLTDLATLQRADLVSMIPKNMGTLEPTPAQIESGDAEESEEPIDSDEEIRGRIVASVAALREATHGLTPGWGAAVVVMPSQQSISLNLKLPFGDPKNLNRIVDLEVQDVVPFDLDEFFVQYSSLGPLGGGAVGSSPSQLLDTRTLFDVHVGVMPRAFVRNILEICKASGIEPNILTVPSSVLGGIFHLAKDYFRSNAAVIFNRGTEYILSIYMHGEVRVEHSIDAAQFFKQSGANPDDVLRRIFTALKLAISAAERRYEAQIQTVYVLGKLPRASQLEQLLGRPMESIQLKDVIKVSDPEVGISALSPIFVAEDSSAPILSNFRVREFSFSPRFGELIAALRSVWKFLAAGVAAAVLLTVGVYALREYSLSRRTSALIEQIQGVIPGFDPPDGDVRAGLLKAETKLSEELGVLGSPAKVTPLDALIEISQRIPESAGVTITAIKISGARATVSGMAPNLSAIEKVERDLKVAKAMFGKVVANPGAAVGQRYNFTIEIVLSQ